ncbi:MAG: hypothetical protein HN390_14775 [Anaerolineae bacterium]|jgi:hypothetical protein|nr:hypothetical protein [Anaerolineae bacterium]MBT7190717.1 hypothetical protein [Anaerolineae bacterium]MBT7989705.1 hypothetical protein [Anaerolineae bacterium]
MKVSIWKVVLGLVLIAMLIGGGSMLYRAGYARGVMSDMSFEDMPFADGGYAEMMPYGGMPGAYGMRGYHSYTPFSLGRMLFGGFIFILIVGGLFRLFGMRRYGYGVPPWAMYRMHREGKGGPWMHHDHPYWGKMNPEGDDEPEEKEESEE